MKNQTFFRSAALLAAIALAVPVFAKPVSKTVKLAQNARVGKSELKAGEYRLLIDENKVTIQKGKNTMAVAEGRWEERAAKSPYDSVLLGPEGQVKEVRFYGEKRVLVLSE
jgi:hypothetical protein